ncbi:MAG: peptide chain release factor N(5)-glutamine methyltransferase [Candidatus Omnitrophota bacterium]|nr:MAG: peptide chain release factor N(5)-glutamine methyltransferase [Candidatus Omnitrophota bacterium]
MAYFLDFELETEGLTFHPRPETELLVEKAVELISKEDLSSEAYPRRNSSLAKEDSRILDIGTGCGNIAISLIKYLPLSRITALDISDTALRAARENAKRYGAEERIEFIKSNLFENLKGRGNALFDLIISNPPYISLEEFSLLPEKVKRDPYLALYGGRDGMDFYRKIVKGAPGYLKRGGILLMEIGYDQSAAVKYMLDSSGIFKDVEIYKDYSGIDRIIKAAKDG